MILSVGRKCSAVFSVAMAMILICEHGVCFFVTRLIEFFYNSHGILTGFPFAWECHGSGHVYVCVVRERCRHCLTWYVRWQSQPSSGRRTWIMKDESTTFTPSKTPSLEAYVTLCYVTWRCVR